ncbi:hypothetical protein PYCCODRAFT_442222 [Trametes coccinea BRFM310]|uniref:Uncharacterized protein n=1 Tax=Trametes coccinea (strain BRFM310) TaxID=1353009 RepID=A0A1Y2ILU3_TRAC3|nr:hypothetical protein PYCCODRAFT_442222 [Trametes coccinea BRFM310]
MIYAYLSLILACSTHHNAITTSFSKKWTFFVAALAAMSAKLVPIIPLPWVQSTVAQGPRSSRCSTTATATKLPHASGAISTANIRSPLPGLGRARLDVPISTVVGGF